MTLHPFKSSFLAGRDALAADDARLASGAGGLRLDDGAATFSEFTVKPERGALTGLFAL